MLRTPFSLEKMEYVSVSGMVIYRSKTHATLKRNFQVLPGAKWLQLLIQHIPDKNEHLVHYYGAYNSSVCVASACGVGYRGDKVT